MPAPRTSDIVVTSTRLHRPERAIVDAAAELEGMTVSQWLRAVAVAAARRRVRAELPAEPDAPSAPAA